MSLPEVSRNGQMTTVSLDLGNFEYVESYIRRDEKFPCVIFRYDLGGRTEFESPSSSVFVFWNITSTGYSEKGPCDLNRVQVEELVKNSLAWKTTISDQPL